MAGSDNGEGRILTSQWGSLSPHLIAKFYPVRRMKQGNGWEQSSGTKTLLEGYTVDDGVEVHCPISDGQSEMTLNWSSPFEGAGAESKAPMLSAMLQSGSATSMLQALAGTGIMSDKLDDLSKKSVDFLRDVEGRTGITKLNSTQIFTGMPPVKMTLTLHFRALIDPAAEVRDPILQLKEWALPQVLSEDGLVAGAVKNGTERKIIESLYPSRTPQIMGMKYGDMNYMPVVIESISEPFTNPRSDKGVMVSSSVQITLATLAALDRRDIRNVYNIR
jgi:hypothetical protein